MDVLFGCCLPDHHTLNVGLVAKKQPKLPSPIAQCRPITPPLHLLRAKRISWPFLLYLQA